jgi:hypothetical protein
VTWNREQYLAEVLEPARKSGNVPPPDLYARYGLPAGLSDQAAFARQVADVVAFWRELKNRRMYARLADTLIAAHAELERAGRLTLRSFAERHEDARREQLDRLTRLAQAEAGAATHVGPGTLARLRGALGGAVSEAEVTAALKKAGVRIVQDFPALPAAPHPKQADLARHLAQLGVWPSATVVFGDAVRKGFGVLGGFRLADGRRLDEGAIAAARGHVDALPYTDPAKTPSENVLAILRAAARTPGDLNTLLLSEVIERLRPLARSGFVQRAIAAQAHESGLDKDEAGLIAAAMVTADTLGALRQQVEDELTGGRLRSAQRLAAGLPADEPLRERVVALDAEVAALTRRADQELSQGRREQAAALLAEAASMARDDAKLPERLAAVPPPAPREAVARMDGDHVLITWKSSPATVGPVQYRVVRGQGRAPVSASEGTAVVTRTERTDATDAEAPPGAHLFYSVFAARGGETWSTPAMAPPAMFTPEVTDVSVAVADTSVAASWRPHPGADGVLVVRRENDPPRGRDDGMAVEASLTGFTDTGLRTGSEYYYRIVTCYRPPDGQRRHSAGVVARAVPEPATLAVTDLDISGPGESGPGESGPGDGAPGDGAPVLLATWTPPPYGQVRLVRSDQPPPWAAGTRITPEDAAGLREIPGVPRRGADGRDVLELRLPPGYHHLLALTVGHNTSVAGHTVEVRLVEPVRGLSADRMHDEVRLGWIWPDGATDALIWWPGGERHCSRRVYDDEGGAVLTIGAAETTVEVRAIYPRRGGRLTAPGTRVRVPARGVAVTYRIRRTSRWHPRQRTIELAAEQATRLPALVVVRSTGRYVPGDPSEGETVARVGPQDIIPGQAAAFPIEVTKGPAWLACFLAPDTPEAEARGILLFPPPAEEMKIR